MAMGRKGNGANKTRILNGSHSKQSPGTLERAFKTALQGRICTICKKRVAHAVYQRHFGDCKIVIDNSGGEEDDIIFCGTFQSSQIDEHLPQQQKEVKTERRSTSDERSSCTIGEDVDTITSPRATTSKQNDSDKIEDNICTIPILEVNELCLHYLAKFIGQNQSFAHGQSQRNSQRIDKENLAQTEMSKSGEANQQQMEEEELNCSFSLSQQMHRKIEQSPPEEVYSARYSLRIVWKILQKVLLCPEHRGFPTVTLEFWGEYLRTLLKFLSLPVETQQLFVLLLKRRWGWHLIGDVQEKYSKVINGDFTIHFKKLCHGGIMEAGSTSKSIPLKDALVLLKKPEILQLCKKFKIIGLGQNLSTLIERFVKLGKQKTILGGKREQIILRNIRTIVGEFFRIKCDVLQLFTAFFTVYSPTYMDTSRLLEYKSNEDLSSNLIFTVLQFENNSLVFPSPSDWTHSLLGIYENVEQLINYINAKQLEQRIIRLLNRQLPAFEETLRCAKEAKERLFNEFLQLEERRKSFYCALSSFHRRFTAPWVLCRCIFKGGAEVAQKLRNYEFAVELLTFLLETDVLRHFCMSSRGKWYERIALDLEHHLKKLNESAHFCRMGMADELVGSADKLILQHRLTKMNNRMKQTPSQTDNCFIELVEAEKMEISGTTLAKGLGDGEQINHFYIPNRNDREEISRCSVEELVLHHFITVEHFTHGLHSEGTVWHSLFRLFFTDIIFDADVPQVWFSQIQDDPLDLNFSDFYQNRKTMIDQRLLEIRTAQNLSVLSQRFFDKIKSKVASNSNILWHNFQNTDQIATFLGCCSPLLLHDLFKELCTNFKEKRSGFPDLVVWNENSATMAVVEVKGPNDSLSAKQQLWLHFFQTHGVRSVVCHVVARNDRML